MRRKDREVVDFGEIIEIMKNCDVCRLALNDAGLGTWLPPAARSTAEYNNGRSRRSVGIPARMR